MSTSDEEGWLYMLVYVISAPEIQEQIEIDHIFRDMNKKAYSTRQAITKHSFNVSH